MAVTLLNVPQKSQPSVLELLLVFGARGHTRCFSMNATALLGIKAELGKLRHKGAYTTEQF